MLDPNRLSRKGLAMVQIELVLNKIEPIDHGNILRWDG